jgi:predicted component of type VI protein secretion system
MAHIYLVWKQPDQPERALIWDTNTISIGRSPENDLSLVDDEVSRRHAVLARGKGGYQVMDFRTSNGTFVNGERVSQERVIQPGDVIRVGAHELTLRVADKHPASLGLKVQYASQLKSVGAIPKGALGDANATMVGLADTQPGDGEDFVVEPERGAGGQAFVVGAEGDHEYQMREIGDDLDSMQLDLDAGGFGGDLDDGFDLDAHDEKPAPPPVAAARPAAPARRAATAPPPAATAAPAEDPTALLRKLKTLHDEGLITEDEYKTKRAEILSRM